MISFISQTDKLQVRLLAHSDVWMQTGFNTHKDSCIYHMGR